MRKVGLEEELLLVEPATGELANVSSRVLRARADQDDAAEPLVADVVARTAETVEVAE